jgi:hypothetical protein
MGQCSNHPEANIGQTVSAEAVDAMRGALNVIARLNTIDPHRPSWRHGSIAWRRAYLRSIIGRPLLSLPIDRLIWRMKLAAALIVLATASLEAYRGLFAAGEYDSPMTAAEAAHASPPLQLRAEEVTRMAHAAVLTQEPKAR